MKEERLILVTNDDGYDSKGLAAAVEVARGFGRVSWWRPKRRRAA